MSQHRDADLPLAVCLRLARAISGTAQLADICEAALQALDEGLGIRQASILLFDPDGVMRCKAWRGLSDRYRAAVEGQVPWRSDARGARPIVAPDVAEAVDLQTYLPMFADQGIAALVLMPLETGSGVIGTLMLSHAEPHLWSPEELALAELIAAQVAMAMAKTHSTGAAQLYGRLTTLVAASASLLGSPEAESVRSATLSLAQQLLAADGFALWSGDYGRSWRVERAAGISTAFAERLVDPAFGSAAPFLAGPMALADVSAEPLLAHQHHEYEAEGIRSLLICPMRLGGGQAGTLTFYYRAAHSFSEAEIQTGQALANIAAAALATAELYDEQRRERQEAQHAQRQAAFLADAAAILSRSLDYEHTLTAVAELAVPEIADWCAVDIVDDTGLLQRLAVAHVDPAKLELAHLLQQRYPPNPSDSGGAHEVVRTGKPVLVSDLPADLLAGVAVDDEHLRLLQALTLSSYICVPLLSSTGTFGAITFVFAESNRHYRERDVAFALDVASRASMAIENAFAYRRASEANRVKDEFLATLSHELRTPLNAILGYAQMINKGIYLPDRQASAMGVLTRNAEALRQIIDDVLDVSRITSGKLRLKTQPVRMEAILDNAIGTVQPAADAKGISLQLVAEPEAGAVLGDPDRLQQVIWNLLSNAVKFTPRGGRVELRLERADGAVQIVVKDEGQGIDPAFIPHLFERFRQADSRLSREHGGLGLGLAIVRELVELHGGTVSGSSDGPGTGATFIVRLPPANRDQSSSLSEA